MAYKSGGRIKIIDYLFLILIIIPFIVFYMLKDFSAIKKATAYVTPKKWHKPGERFLSDVNESLGNYIRGQFFVCLIIGVIATAALWFFHVPYALLLGFIIGVTNIIPYFGPIIGAVPAAIIATTISIKLVITIVIIIFVFAVSRRKFAVSAYRRKEPSYSSFVYHACAPFRRRVWGVLGLILAVPILAVVKISILHIRSYTLKH